MRTPRLLSLLLSLVLLTGFVTAPAVAQPLAPPPSEAAHVAAGFANVFYVPGKALTCAGSAVLWVVILGVSFGTLYEDATHIDAGGCGGKWTVHGRDLQPALQAAAP